MANQFGRRKTDQGTGVPGATEWLDVLQQARAKFMQRVTGEFLPASVVTRIELRDDIESRLRESLTKTVLSHGSIEQAVSDMKEATLLDGEAIKVATLRFTDPKT